MITLDKLKEILFYDHETGIFTWLISVAHRVSIGDEAGYLHSSGYFRSERGQGGSSQKPRGMTRQALKVDD